MTKDQKTAIKAMMYSFDKYGAKRLCGSTYIPNIKNDPEYTMSFGEAYNICDEMVNEVENAYAIETCNLELALENEDLEEKLKKLTDVLEAVYKCPACILDRNDALNKIMETYKEVRNKCIHQKQYY